MEIIVPNTQCWDPALNNMSRAFVITCKHFQLRQSIQKMDLVKFVEDSLKQTIPFQIL